MTWVSHKPRPEGRGPRGNRSTARSRMKAPFSITFKQLQIVKELLRRTPPSVTAEPSDLRFSTEHQRTVYWTPLGPRPSGRGLPSGGGLSETQARRESMLFSLHRKRRPVPRLSSRDGGGGGILQAAQVQDHRTRAGGGEIKRDAVGGDVQLAFTDGAAQR